MAPTAYDIAIIGGGINGCGIARDAAGRGLSVYLCEQNDFASSTSSASTKLIHGGLRYLEFYEFRLVREALIERERLLKIAPHVIWPLRFILPHHAGLRPRWLLRLGLFLYDRLGSRKILPGSRGLTLKGSPYGEPLKDIYRAGFEYSDCWVDDARLVVLNAMDAAARGAELSPRTKCVSARRDGGLWRVAVEGPGGHAETIIARCLVNAAGPWVGHVLHEQMKLNTPAPIRLVKGSHIVVPKIFAHDRAYIFQNADNRIIFAIPYERDFTLIGTTDLDFREDPAKVAATSQEIEYLCASASEYFKRPVTPGDVVWTYSGVRPLYDDGEANAQETTRDYVLDLDAPEQQAPLLTIFGGKITTYRRLAEEVLQRLSRHLPVRKPWTSLAALPGGDFPVTAVELEIERLRSAYPFLKPDHARRLVRAYGTRADLILGGAGRMEDLGRVFGPDLTEAEVSYLMQNEWAQTAEDVLWRRSKIGLRISAEDKLALDNLMRSGRVSAPSAA
ncbi:glycerol-3-phosphate dehydrogenase [Terrihabitans soli]|uniref:Glycerol-3-phosphate dehydrogenase n=1 Tax=Terrihabitans soli TaxID=708113 RepID=A0A6S6QYW5_9HYPH|nr:glycerol-3-phosphate dehydrogenase [Terrihabitans soli]BCJ92221.1 glycerol-3-phosphate dehydrogenase [Terrihabitans soli]